MIHKWAKALSVTVTLHKRKAGICKIFIVLSIFSILEPVSIGIGWAILVYTSKMVNVVAGAISAGAFLFIGAS